MFTKPILKICLKVRQKGEKLNIANNSETMERRNKPLIKGII